MRLYFPLFLALQLSFLSAKCQKLEVLYQADSSDHPASKQFALLSDKTDTSSLIYIGSYKITAEYNETKLLKLYTILREAARFYKANAFRVRAYYPDGENEKQNLSIDTYYANDELLKLNANNFEKNIVYVFGSKNIDLRNKYSITVNKEKIDFYGNYYPIKLAKDAIYEIKKRPLSTQKITKKFEQDQAASFLLLEKPDQDLFVYAALFGLVGVGVALLANPIEELITLDNDYGQLLLQLQNQVETQSKPMRLLHVKVSK